jgi:hypothetical protein
MDTFLKADFLIEPPLKWIFRGGRGATVLPCAVRGGVLVEPPLIEKGVVAKNHLCTSVQRTRQQIIVAIR